MGFFKRSTPPDPLPTTSGQASGLTSPPSREVAQLREDLDDLSRLVRRLDEDLDDLHERVQRIAGRRSKVQAIDNPPQQPTGRSGLPTIAQLRAGGAYPKGW